MSPSYQRLSHCSHRRHLSFGLLSLFCKTCVSKYFGEQRADSFVWIGLPYRPKGRGVLPFPACRHCLSTLLGGFHAPPGGRLPSFAMALLGKTRESFSQLTASHLRRHSRTFMQMLITHQARSITWITTAARFVTRRSLHDTLPHYTTASCIANSTLLSSSPLVAVAVVKQS